MPGQHTLAETEQATANRVGDLPLDFAAAHAVASLYRAANAARQHLTAGVLAPHGLTWAGFLVLWLLWIWGDMTAREVAGNVGMSKANLTGVARTLAGRGLISRHPDPSDKRLLKLSLTPEGKELMAALYPEFNRAETRLMAAISSENARVLTECLRRIVEVAETGQVPDERRPSR